MATLLQRSTPTRPFINRILFQFQPSRKCYKTMASNHRAEDTALSWFPQHPDALAFTTLNQCSAAVQQECHLDVLVYGRILCYMNVDKCTVPSAASRLFLTNSSRSLALLWILSASSYGCSPSADTLVTWERTHTHSISWMDKPKQDGPVFRVFIQDAQFPLRTRWFNQLLLHCQFNEITLNQHEIEVKLCSYRCYFLLLSSMHIDFNNSTYMYI